MTLGELIKSYRKEHHMSQQAFADASGLSKAYVSILERAYNPVNGKAPVPSLKTIKTVSAVIGMDLDSVIATLDPNTKVSLTETEDQELPDNIFPLSVTKIPLVGTIACGTPIFAEENITDYVDLPEHIRADFALRCKGDSMIGAGIQDGDVVYIRRQPTVFNGQIAAVLIEDEATLKRFRRKGDTVILQSENPMIDPFIYVGEEINNIQIMGLAVAHTRSLKGV